MLRDLADAFEAGTAECVIVASLDRCKDCSRLHDNAALLLPPDRLDLGLTVIGLASMMSARVENAVRILERANRLETAMAQHEAAHAGKH